MRVIVAALVSCLLLEMPSAAEPQGRPQGRVGELKASDGIALKATYFAAGKPGPGVILFHQSNRTRESWGGVASQLAAAGMNVLTVDSRGHGESGGTTKDAQEKRNTDLDTVFQFL